jgi:hypothetical protein
MSKVHCGNGGSQVHGHCGDEGGDFEDAPTIKAGGKEYDLSTEKGRKAFGRDVEDGKLDGKKGKGGDFEGVSYDPETNTVYAEGKKYDLNDPEQVHNFKRDARDGRVDGEIGPKKSGGKGGADEVPDHLENVRAGEEEYDLSTEEGKDAFEADIVDGKVDGEQGEDKMNVTYDRENNVVYAGDKKYDLNNVEEYHKFRRDARDGNLDGRTRGERPNMRDAVSVERPREAEGIFETFGKGVDMFHNQVTQTITAPLDFARKLLG